MLFILSNTFDPYFNIAAEEYLLKEFTDDVIMLYRNEPSIIVGKHQNTFAEINYSFVSRNNIKVVRRLSGGGTVFHDTGNLNFCFIQNGKEGSQVDFVKFTEPVLQTLLKLGIPASRSGRNDLLAEHYKISGNAEHVYKNRTLHHGTLLFSSKLDKLKEGLKVKQELFTDKAVRSVRSEVTNINNYTPGLDIESFIGKMAEGILSFFTPIEQYHFNHDDQTKIQKLLTEKYATWEWNYGYSPKFKVKKTGIILDKTITLEIIVDKGIIKSIEADSTLQEPLSVLTNIPYREETVMEKLLLFTGPNQSGQWLKVFFE